MYFSLSLFLIDKKIKIYHIFNFLIILFLYKDYIIVNSKMF